MRRMILLGLFIVVMLRWRHSNDFFFFLVHARKSYWQKCCRVLSTLKWVKMVSMISDLSTDVDSFENHLFHTWLRRKKEKIHIIISLVVYFSSFHADGIINTLLMWRTYEQKCLFMNTNESQWYHKQT